MSYDYDDEPREHECPRPLEEKAEEFAVGGVFFSPAGRWETITERSPFREYSVRVMVHTDRTGPGYGWHFWGSTKLPYLPSWMVQRRTYVCISETTSIMDVEVSESPRDWGHGYPLLTARMTRGEGWTISDTPDGQTVENVTVPNKARARTEVKRRATAHAKALGLKVWIDGAGEPQ
jgi:hypothetical protein